MQQASLGRHLGGIWRHLGGIWRHLGDIWRHLGGIWETSGEAFGGIWSSGRPEAALEEKVCKTIVFFCKKSRDRPFRLSSGGVTLTISAACASTRASDLRGRGPGMDIHFLTSPPEPL